MRTSPIPVPSRFVREETIAEGAVASVCRARDLVSGGTVRLVQVRPEQAADAFFLARFGREARLLGTIDHPNVVRVVASGIEQGIPFVATAHVPGQTLAELIRAHGRMAAGEVVGLGRQILAGLGAIHAAGLLHLRLTPRTVLVGDDGVVRITDVGIASLGEAGDVPGRGTAVEVARYLAPELIEGGDVCEATDLYAIATILFEALTGRPPFPGNNPVLVRFAQVHASPPAPSEVAPPGVPPELDAVLLRALDKGSTRRHADAHAMAVALAAIGTESKVDRLIGQTPAREVTPPKPAAEAAVIRPLGSIGTGQTKRVGPRRQAAGGWTWPIAIACAAIMVLIGALAVSLSDDAPANQTSAGVAVDVMGPGHATTASGAAPTPTLRVMRTSGSGELAVPAGNAFRASAGTDAQKQPATQTPQSGG